MAAMARAWARNLAWQQQRHGSLGTILAIVSSRYQRLMFDLVVGAQEAGHL